jgi:arabinofuranosyltransferase
LAASAALALAGRGAQRATAQNAVDPAENAARGAASGSESRQAFLALALPVVILVGSWMGWKLAYYGRLLPNTYAAKVAWSGSNVTAGFLYAWRFVAAYSWWPLLAVAGIDWVVRLLPGRAVQPATAAAPGASEPLAAPGGAALLPAGVGAALWTTLAVLVASWLAYLVAIGGDFMEFRFFVPVMPFLCLGLVARLATALPRRIVSPALAVLVLVLGFASLQHARHFRGVTPDHRLDSVPALATFYELYPDRDFAPIGTELGRQLAGTDALLALHAVGAIPYYSNLRTLDMFGLNDAQVAVEGHHAPPEFLRPGHQRQVTLAELRRRNVNLVIGHPTLVPRGTLADPRVAVYAQWVRDVLGYSREPVGSVRLVGMPLPRGDLLIWYLTPSPEIDAAIRAHDWGTASIEVTR